MADDGRGGTQLGFGFASSASSSGSGAGSGFCEGFGFGLPSSFFSAFASSGARELDLSGMRTAEHVEALGLCVELESLNIRGCPTADLSPLSLCRLLRSLNLRGCARVDDITPVRSVLHTSSICRLTAV